MANTQGSVEEVASKPESTANASDGIDDSLASNESPKASPDWKVNNSTMRKIVLRQQLQ